MKFAEADAPNWVKAKSVVADEDEMAEAEARSRYYRNVERQAAALERLVNRAAILERLRVEWTGSRESSEQYESEGTTYLADIARAHAWAFSLAIDILEGNG